MIAMCSLRKFWRVCICVGSASVNCFFKANSKLICDVMFVTHVLKYLADTSEIFDLSEEIDHLVSCCIFFESCLSSAIQTVLLIPSLST